MAAPSVAGKCVVLGVTGSIAAYKACEIASLLVKRRADVYVIMTQNACSFVAPLTFETLTKHPVAVDLFAPKTSFEVEHISLAQRADVFVVAPATANLLAKAYAGIADDMLTTTLLATRAPVLLAPAMNVNMYENPVTQRNLRGLAQLGYHFAEPVVGDLACGVVAKGHIAPVELIVERTAQLACLKQA